MNWTHSICDDCWTNRSPHQEPTRIVVDTETETCCWCGIQTTSGIFVRADPATLSCQHSEGPRTKHTPEPWVFTADGGTHREENDGITEDTFYQVPPEDYARAVACVNACTGINPEAVPNLLAALIAILGWRETDLPEGDRAVRAIEFIEQVVRAAIAKTEVSS